MSALSAKPLQDDRVGSSFAYWQPSLEKKCYTLVDRQKMLARRRSRRSASRPDISLSLRNSEKQEDNMVMKKICWICEEEINRKDTPYWSVIEGYSHTGCKNILDLVRSNKKIREKVKEVLDGNQI